MQIEYRFTNKGTTEMQAEVNGEKITVPPGHTYIGLSDGRTDTAGDGVGLVVVTVLMLFAVVGFFKVLSWIIAAL